MIKEIAAALDIHQKRFNIAIRKNNGSFIAEQEFPNDMDGAKECANLLALYGCIDVALESTGPYWFGVYDYLTLKGVRVIVVNPARAKSNVQNKSDKLDARALATLHLFNHLKASYVPDQGIRRLRRLTRFRAKLVDMRTRVKNSLHASVSTYSSGITAVFSDVFGASGRKVLEMISTERIAKEGILPEADDALMERLSAIKRMTSEQTRMVASAISKAYTPSLDSWIIQFGSSIISQIASWIKVIDDSIASAVESMPRIKEYVERLVTIPGVGLDTAQAIAAEIADIVRFDSSGALVRYSGLNPRLEMSGSVRRYGKLEKGGPKWLRRALYQAAHVIAFKGPLNFQKHYGAVSARYGKKAGHGVGIVSTARKLVRLIYAMLTDKTGFIDSPEKLTTRKRAMLLRRAERFGSSAEENRPSLVSLILNLDKLTPEVREMMLAQL